MYTFHLPFPTMENYTEGRAPPIAAITLKKQFATARYVGGCKISTF